MNNMPLVSCIMPTAGRPDFLLGTVRQFLRQNYPARELVIIDDSETSARHLVPASPLIRYYYLRNSGLSTGVKRNLACERAKGSVILHWDDDDWYAPDWITRQVSLLIKSRADLCGLTRLHFLDPAAATGWTYTQPGHERPWVAGATMVYHRSLWQRYPFPDLRIGEDNDFAWHSGGSITVSDYSEGFVAMLHGRNTSPKPVYSTRWAPCEAAPLLQKTAFLLADRLHRL